MRVRPILGGLTMILVTAGLPGAARAERVDVVVLQNGTRVIGEVKSMKRGRLELKTDDMGTVQIEWDNVVQVSAPGYFEVEDMGGRLHFGALRPAAQGGRLEVTSPLGAHSLRFGEVARIQLVKASFWERLTGSIDLGAGYTSATQLRQFELDADVHFRRPKFETMLTASAVLTHQPGVEDTRRTAIGLTYNRLFSNRQRAFALGTVEQNRELGYDLRASAAGGWGTYLARNSSNELLGGVGLGVNREVPVEGATTTNVEAVLTANYANFTYDFPNTEIEVGTVAYLGLSQWGRFRLEASGDLRREIFKDFYVGLKGYESYDSQPATAGAQQNDWGFSLSLGWTF